METYSSEPQLQWPDESKDDRDNIAKPAGRTSGESRQWGMCTIGCMYREEVDGGYDDTAMAVEQRRQKSSSSSTSPRRDRSRTTCWYAKRASGGGRRAASGPRCAVQEARRTSMLAGREGYMSGAPKPDSPAAGCRGMGAGVTSQGCAPGLYLQCARVEYTWRRRRCYYCSHAGSSGVRVLMARQCWRDPAPGAPTTRGE